MLFKENYDIEYKEIQIIGEKLINTCNISIVTEENMDKMNGLTQK